MKKLLTVLLLLLTPLHVLAQSTPDAALLADINRVKAIDNHAHPMSAGPPEDEEFDAIACGKLESIAPPTPPTSDRQFYIHRRVALTLRIRSWQRHEQSEGGRTTRGEATGNE